MEIATDTRYVVVKPAPVGGMSLPAEVRDTKPVVPGFDLIAKCPGAGSERRAALVADALNGRGELLAVLRDLWESHADLLRIVEAEAAKDSEVAGGLPLAEALPSWARAIDAGNAAEGMAESVLRAAD